MTGAVEALKRTRRTDDATVGAQLEDLAASAAPLSVFGYGLLSDVDALTIVLAALGAICVASAVLLILELSDPYSGLFRMPHEGFDGIIRVLTKGAEMAANPET
jgi:hypothetical protein